MLNKCESISDLENINLNDKNVIMKAKDINIGFASRSVITELKRKDLVTNAQVAKLFNDAIMFVRSIVVKLFDNSPLKKCHKFYNFRSKGYGN